MDRFFEWAILVESAWLDCPFGWEALAAAIFRILAPNRPTFSRSLGPGRQGRLAINAVDGL